MTDKPAPMDDAEFERQMQHMREESDALFERIMHFTPAKIEAERIERERAIRDVSDGTRARATEKLRDQWQRAHDRYIAALWQLFGEITGSSELTREQKDQWRNRIGRDLAAALNDKPPL